MTLSSSTVDLTNTNATAGSEASSGEGNTYATARARVTGTNSLYLTADEGVLAGNPFASSTEEKETRYTGIPKPENLGILKNRAR